MDISRLWDFQILVFGAVCTIVVIFMLVVLGLISRKLRYFTSEFESLRRDVRMLEDGVRTVTENLLAKADQDD